MSFLCHLRAHLGGVLRARLRKQAQGFLDSTHRCRDVQERVLEKLLHLNGTSQYAQKYHLKTSDSISSFRRKIPVSNFDDYAPYVEKMKTGETDALLGPKNKLLMFTLSSGTTSHSKFIPITNQFLDDYKRGWQTWGIRAFDDHPGVHTRKILQLTSDYDKFRTPAQTPCGNISGLVAAMQKKIVRTMYCVPRKIAKIEDPDAKLYATLRFALADRNLGFVATANPSTLIQVAKFASSFCEDLIRDIADGTLSRKFQLPKEVSAGLAKKVKKKNRRRARELDKIVERTGEFLPKDYWNELQLIGVWTGGSAGAYLDGLHHNFGDIPVRDHGLSASEGRMSFPFHDRSSSGVLDIGTHFFEFIPEDEYDRPNPTLLQAYELEPEQNYFILLTTSSGFYRYDICDVVRCTGFFNSTPMIEFLNKGSHISNITGEKISESQVVEAVKVCVAELQLQVKHFTVSPAWGEPPRYHLMIEETDLPGGAVGKKLARKVDDRLQQLNCEYRDKRTSGRLDTIVWIPLPAGTWQRFSRRGLSQLGGSVEQYKHPCLVTDMNFSESLVEQFGRTAA